MQNCKEIELELFSVENQEILEKRFFKLNLCEFYLKYSLSFRSLELDESSLLGDLDFKKPSEESWQEEINYIDKNSITGVAITYNHLVNDKEKIWILVISTQDGDLVKALFKTKKEAIAVQKELVKWRWGE